MKTKADRPIPDLKWSEPFNAPKRAPAIADGTNNSKAFLCIRRITLHNSGLVFKLSQDWNEYVEDYGTRIKIQPMVMRVAKTSRFDTRGEPLYWVDIKGSSAAFATEIAKCCNSTERHK